MRKLIIAVLAGCFATAAWSQVVTLKAKDYDGKTQYFVRRESNWNGEEVWGIKGEGTTGEVHSGDMWFNSFPGATATYTVEFGVVLEPDGNPEYALSAGSTLLKKGRYPYPSGQSTYKCDGGSTEKHWINIGDHAISSGAKINVWGKSLYYCGSGTSWHGAYTRWFEVKFTKVGGTTGPATDITSPAAGADLTEGKEYTFTADGDNVSWSYDANSDGKGSVDIGTGNSVKFTIPTGVTGDRTITITASGDNGTDAVTCNIVAGSGILDFGRTDMVQIFGLAASPEPFSVCADVTFNLPQAGHTSLKVFDSRGTLVRTLADGVLPAGDHSLTLQSGNGMGEGVYFMVLQHPAGTQAARVMVVK